MKDSTNILRARCRLQRNTDFRRYAGFRSLLLLFVFGTVSFSQTRVLAADRLPPAGISIPDAERQELTAGAATLHKEIEALRKDLAAKPTLLQLLPDVEIFHKAVDWALRYGRVL